MFAKVSGTDDSSSDCDCTVVDESFRMALSEELPRTTTVALVAAMAVVDAVPTPPPPPPLPPVTIGGRLPLFVADELVVLLVLPWVAMVLPTVVVAVEEEIPPDSCWTGSA